MALTNCKECGGKVSNKADQCPHCGVKLKSGGVNWLWIIAVAGIIIVGYSAVISDSSTDTDISNPNNFLAYNYAMDAVKKKIKSPSTAKFPGINEKNNHINSIGSGEYHIASWVDSQNSFGATIRSNFSIIVVFGENKVSFKNLKIE